MKLSVAHFSFYRKGERDIQTGGLSRSSHGIPSTSKLEELKMWNSSAGGQEDRTEPETNSGGVVPPRYPGVPPYIHYPEGTLEVRAEEALLVVLVLLLWVGAIVLFFNRWGKIRMLEPYQPKFHQEHRSSCPMGDMTSVSQHRTSFSKYNVSLETPLLGPMPSAYRNLLRPRQNSVFVGSVIKLNPPRKTKSAIDLQSLVTNETSPGVSRSILPMFSIERRPSSCIFSERRREDQMSIELQSPATNDNSPGVPKGSLLPTLSVERRPSSCVFPGRRPSSAGYLSPRRPSVVHLSDLLPPGAFTGSRERRPSFNNVIAQVTAERRPSSSMLRIVNV